jgi:hypothetical protein
MIVYKINNSKIVSINTEANDYVLQPNEYSSNVWYQKPHFNGSNVVESITQQEIDDRIEAEAEELISRELLNDLNEGIKAANKLKVYLYRNLTTAQYVTTKKILLPTWTALMMGNWEIALEEITLVDDLNSTAISRKIKLRIENYIQGVTQPAQARKANVQEVTKSKAIYTNSTQEKIVNISLFRKIVTYIKNHI